MYNLDLQWKSFNIDIPTVTAAVVALEGDNYVGCSADHDLSLHFTTKPSDDNIAEIKSYWDGIAEQGNEHSKYCAQATIISTISSLRTGLISKEWADMSVAERKIAVGLTPTRADLGL